MAILKRPVSELLAVHPGEGVAACLWAWALPTLPITTVLPISIYLHPIKAMAIKYPPNHLGGEGLWQMDLAWHSVPKGSLHGGQAM